MRQVEDHASRSFLARARAGSLTDEDLHQLNSKVISSLSSPEMESATSIVRLNALRQCINRCQLYNFARRRCQWVYVFPAQHGRTVSTTRSPLSVEKLLHQPDEGTKCPFPGLFLYSAGMPAMVLANICTSMGQVNGARGTVTGIVVDPTGMYYLYISVVYH